MSAASERSIDDLIFAGFNRRVVAVDRYTGEKVWDWRAPSGSGYVSLLLDGDRLVASAQGYLYCLDPLYGQLVWENPLKGFGVGVTSLVSTRGKSPDSAAAAKVAADQQAAAAAAAT